MEEVIRLKDILLAIRKRVKWLILITSLSVLISASASYFFLTPTYQASTMLLVNQSQKQEEFYTSGDIRTNIELINTYKVIILSPRILEQVVEELALDLTHKELSRQIQVGSASESQVVSIVVEDMDPVLAAEIANTTAQVFQREIIAIMNVDNVSIVSPAEPDNVPIKPNHLFYMVFAFVIGLFAAVTVILLLEAFDKSIQSEEDVEKVLELPVLGVIMVFDEKQEPFYEEQRNPLSRLERFRKGSESIGS
ncbi:Capsular polysaccharide biosynthesis protein [Evansella caseinilytica]|uniref:Capsular polysaccharide biosynthesis protein n=1 Tax=Evansella caseinilytica TaxID=1503961 RepID=A0A1H3ULT7_9BACI|nr:Wzz/FepE/Etk N-terminal domain-containing protein [Evansella caseinilytica]SDZ63317.1 Capsular polysaccharide biosynthesis protein [Evansella caseinilytica]